MSPERDEPGRSAGREAGDSGPTDPGTDEDPPADPLAWRSTPETTPTSSTRDGGGRRGRLRRWRGLLGLGVRRVVGRSTGTGDRRVLAGVLGTAVAVALLVALTGVGVGLAADATVHGSDVDYWVVPETDGGSALVDTGGPSLGSVHAASARVRTTDGVGYATPVLSEPMRLAAGDATAYVLVVGVLGGPDATRIAGVTPEDLTPGDPHYAGGAYDGPWTGELVASGGAASVLDLGSGDEVSSASADRSFRVAGIDRESGGPAGSLPVVLVHLSELQVLTGADEHDAADQLLVATSDSGVESRLAGLYDGATVETRSSLLAAGTVDQSLALALTLGALVVALVVGVLFVTVTLGLEVLDQGPELAAMRALGLGHRSRLAVVAVQSVTTAFLGGIAGVVLGGLLVAVVNRAGASLVGISGSAVFHPLLVPYGLGAAVVVGVLALPPVLWLVERASRSRGAI